MKKVILCFGLIILFTQIGSAQGLDKLPLADVYKDMGQYEKAIELYQNHHEELDAFQLYDLASLYTITNQNDKAIDTYIFLLTQYPDFQKGYLPLAHTLRKDKQYALAMKYYEVYANFDPVVSRHYVQCMRWAEAQRKAHKDDIHRESLDINTTQFEGFPIKYNENIVYASNRSDITRTVNKGDQGKTQLFSTHFSGTGNYTRPSFLLKDLQEWQSMATIAMNPGSNEIIFTKISQPSILQEFRSHNAGMKLYTANLVDGELKNMKPMPFNSINYNTAGACYSDDGNTIYFMSNKKGGFGGYDLYSSTRTSDGSWTTPVNLGSRVNTCGDEIFPQIVNGRLVFASNWLMGFGGFDLFVTEFNYYGMQWDKVENLGYGINTSRDEFAMIKINDKYFLTAMNPQRNTDLYTYSELPLLDNQPVIVKASLKTDHVDMSNDFNSAFANEEMEQPEHLNENLGEKSQEQHEASTMLLSQTGSVKKIIEKNSNRDFRKLYSVQVAIVGKENKEMLQFYGNEFNDIDDVYKIYFPEVIKIRVGSYDSYTAAEKTLNIIRSRGYSDAFIVAEKVVYSSSHSEMKPVVESPQNVVNKVQAGQVENKSISNLRQVDVNPIRGAKYMIRLATYSQPKWFNQDKVNTLGNVMRIDKEQWTIFLLGSYSTINEAEFIKEKVVKRGFKDAQVVTLVDGMPKRVERE